MNYTILMTLKKRSLCFLIKKTPTSQADKSAASYADHEEKSG